MAVTNETFRLNILNLPMDMGSECAHIYETFLKITLETET
jgi:hypothetical protein